MEKKFLTSQRAYINFILEHPYWQEKGAENVEFFTGVEFAFVPPNWDENPATILWPSQLDALPDAELGRVEDTYEINTNYYRDLPILIRDCTIVPDSYPCLALYQFEKSDDRGTLDIRLLEFVYPSDF